MYRLCGGIAGLIDVELVRGVGSGKFTTSTDGTCDLTARHGFGGGITKGVDFALERDWRLGRRWDFADEWMGRQDGLNSESSRCEGRTEPIGRGYSSQSSVLSRR